MRWNGMEWNGWEATSIRLREIRYDNNIINPSHGVQSYFILNLTSKDRVEIRFHTRMPLFLFLFCLSLVPFPHLIQPLSLLSLFLYFFFSSIFTLFLYRIRESTSQASSTASSYLSEFLSKPKLWVSSLGLVNSILLGGLGFFAYTRRDQIRNADRRLLTAGVVGVLALLGGQGWVEREREVRGT